MRKEKPAHTPALGFADIVLLPENLRADGRTGHDPWWPGVNLAPDEVCRPWLLAGRDPLFRTVLAYMLHHRGISEAFIDALAGQGSAEKVVLYLRLLGIAIANINDDYHQPPESRKSFYIFSLYGREKALAALATSRPLVRNAFPADKPKGAL